MKYLSFTILCLLSLLLISCGGGGGGGGGGTQPTAATLHFSTAGNLQGKLIQGISMTVNFPSGVTVKMVGNSPDVTASGVISGTGTITIDPSKTDTSKVTFNVVAPPFGTGEFATLNCVISGSNPLPTDFSVSNVSVFDTNIVPITGVSVTFTADIR